MWVHVRSGCPVKDKDTYLNRCIQIEEYLSKEDTNYIYIYI